MQAAFTELFEQGKKNLQEIKSQTVEMVNPLIEFWSKPFLSHAQQQASESAETATTNSNVHEIKRSDYSIISANRTTAETLLGFCQRNSTSFDFYQRNFFWAPFTAMLELLINQIAISFTRLPQIQLTPEKHEQVIVKFEDAGQSSFHVYRPQSLIHLNNPMTPAVLFFPSLTQNQEGLTGLIRHCIETKGWYVVVMNRRGLDGYLKTPKFWVCGNDQDTRAMLIRLRSMPDFIHQRPLFAIGWSMGGAQLTRYLGKYNTAEDREVDGILGAANISGPLHSSDVQFADNKLVSHLTGWLKRRYCLPKYSEFFNSYKLEPVTVDQLLNTNAVRRHESEMHEYATIFQNLHKTNTPYEFMYLHFHLLKSFTNEDVMRHVKDQISRLPDNSVLKRESENKTLNELINENSTLVFSYFPEHDASTYASQIRVPLVSIVAKDDPIVRWSPESRDAYLQSPTTSLILTRGGSHCLFKANPLDVQSESFAEAIAFLYFQTILDKMKPEMFLQRLHS